MNAQPARKFTARFQTVAGAQQARLDPLANLILDLRLQRLAQTRIEN